MRHTISLVLAHLVFLAALAAFPGPASPGDEGLPLYNQNCADCHRRNGEGLPDKFPSLAGNPLVLGDTGKLADTVLQGRRGKLGLMPSWKGALTDGQIASILTYIRGAWGNQASPIAEQQVSKRSQP